MSDPASIRRQLKIKTGVTERLTKEHKLYRKETEVQQRKRDKLIADGAEDWDIKNAGKMLDESNKMILDSADRLEKAVADLRDLIVAAKKDPAMAGASELERAETAANDSGL